MKDYTKIGSYIGHEAEVDDQEAAAARRVDGGGTKRLMPGDKSYDAIDALRQKIDEACGGADITHVLTALCSNLANAIVQQEPGNPCALLMSRVLPLIHEGIHINLEPPNGRTS